MNTTTKHAALGAVWVISTASLAVSDMGKDATSKAIEASNILEKARQVGKAEACVEVMRFLNDMLEKFQDTEDNHAKGE